MLKNKFVKITFIIFGFFLFLSIITPSEPTENYLIKEDYKQQEIQTKEVKEDHVVTQNDSIEDKEKIIPVTQESESKVSVVKKETTPIVAEEEKELVILYKVVNVVDGDTIKVNINGTTETLRLIGMDTPETVDPRKPVQCFGKEASDKAKELLTGTNVYFEKDSSQGEFDKYGRTLAYVYREDGLFYNKYMIEQGYAHEYTYNTPYKYQTEFKQAELNAEKNNLGLWSPITCNGDTTSSVISSQTEVSSGKFYTSSYHSAKYYYPELCDGWQSLSASYLKSFDSLESLLSIYPSRTLSPQCP